MTVSVKVTANIPIKSDSYETVTINPIALYKAINAIIDTVPDEVKDSVQIRLRPIVPHREYYSYRHNPWDYANEVQVSAVRDLTAEEREQKARIEQETIKFNNMIQRQECDEPSCPVKKPKVSLFDPSSWTGRK